MLGVLQRDSGARFALCQMLTLSEMSLLHPSCHAWCHWRDTLPPGPVTGPKLRVLSSTVLLAVQSSWAGRWTRSLDVCIHGRKSFDDSNAFAAVIAATLQLLPAAFPLLRSLDLFLTSVELATVFGCLDALSNCASLRQLSIMDVSVAKASMGALLQKLGLMRNLRKLSLGMPFPQALQSSWAHLASLPHLHTLQVRRLDLDMLRDLAFCPAPTQLDMDWPWTEKMLRTFADSRRSADAAPIWSLGLEDTAITTEVWAQLTRFSSLTDLWPMRWTLSAEQWAELPRAFPQLRRQQIRESRGGHGRPNDSARRLPVVRQCTQLTELRVTHQSLPFVQLQQLLDALPLLSTLRLSCCVLPLLESVAPLVAAPALTDLSLTSELSANWPRDPRADWRPLLPPLLKLRRLVVSGPTDAQTRVLHAEQLYWHACHC